MIERRIQLAEGARLTLNELASGARLSGWDEADVLIILRDGHEDQISIEDSEGGPVVSVLAACEVQVPATRPVTVRQARANLRATGLADLNAEQVRGNLHLSDVHQTVLAEVYGNLIGKTLASLRLVGTVYGDAALKAVETADLQNVRGNLRARAVDHLRVSRVGGNLHAREIEGTLDADQVGGNAALKGITGLVTVDQVAGNLTAKDLAGGAKVGRAGGNLVLNGELGTGCTYQFKVDGNAALRLGEDANTHLTLSARGHLLTTIELADEERDGTKLTGTLGDGGAEMVIEAGGSVVLGAGRPPVGAEVAEEISRQMEESLRAIDLEAIGQHVQEQMEQAMSRLRVKLESVDWERTGHRAQQAIERAMERMQQDMDRLTEKAARRQERLQRLAEREARRQERLKRMAEREAHLHEKLAHRFYQTADYEPQSEGREAESGVEPMEPEPALDEERLSILKMVEQGQISPQEAEMLLDALE
jgi:hypothetical protein